MKTRRPAATVVFAMIIVLAFITFLIFYTANKPVTQICDYSGGNYVGKSVDECSTIRFLCVKGKEYFSDECGCGCKPVVDDKNYCVNESRNSDVCTENYQPVCGWFGSQVQCLRYPCAQNYGNSCGACQNENVDYWTNGACPV